MQNVLPNSSVARLRAMMTGGAPALRPQQQPQGEPQRLKSVQGLSRDQLHELMLSMVDAEPWDYYDTRLFSANTMGNDTGAFNFAQCVSPLPFFNSRTIGNSGYAITSMSDNQKTDADFFCERITIDVFCDTDAPSVPGVATAGAFIEEVVNYGVLQIIFGTNTKLLWPVIKAPSGGGVVQAVKVRTQALAAYSDSASANNGLQIATAARELDVPIFFKEGTAFTANIIFPQSASSANGALSRIQNLQPLSSNFMAGIRVNFEGTRGRALLPGSA